MAAQADELDPIAQQVDSWFERNFSRNLTPDFLVQLRRFIAKGQRMSSASFSVGTAAVMLVARDAQRVEVFIYNNGGSAIFIGGRKVTTGPIGDQNAGIPIQPATGMIIDSNVGEIWAISTQAAMDVRVLDSTGNL